MAFNTLMISERSDDGRVRRDPAAAPRSSWGIWGCCIAAPGLRNNDAGRAIEIKALAQVLGREDHHRDGEAMRKQIGRFVPDILYLPPHCLTASVVNLTYVAP